MRFLRTITFRQYMTSSDSSNALIDIKSVPPFMRMDYYRRNDNVEQCKALCDRCDGTGNELVKCHRVCRECGGNGRV